MATLKGMSHYNKDELFVKTIACADENEWYAKRIGEIFEVSSKSLKEGAYIVWDSAAGYSKWISMKDVEVVRKKSSF